MYLVTTFHISKPQLPPITWGRKIATEVRCVGGDAKVFPSEFDETGLNEPKLKGVFVVILIFSKKLLGIISEVRDVTVFYSLPSLLDKYGMICSKFRTKCIC